MLNKITIRGFKSIRQLEAFDLKKLNVLIGGNGAGKSNFIQIFKMLAEMSRQNFIEFIQLRGGADSFLHNGIKVTQRIEAEFDFETNSYKFNLKPTLNETFLINEWRRYGTHEWRDYGSSSEESKLKDKCNEKALYHNYYGVGHYVYSAISNWVVYHFHDTSETSPMRRSEIVEDHHVLRSNAANIAPFLLNLRNKHPESYQDIVNAVRLVNPFFDDFRLDINTMGEAEKVKLSWNQKGSNYPMQPYHFSDGSIRFICLATALLQPTPPSTIVIDEPELGLHPQAIVILGELVQAAARRTQVIVATQSPDLIDQFSIEDIVVVNRKDGQSTFERLNESDFSVWLEEYSVGELWTKNVIQGCPTNE